MKHDTEYICVCETWEEPVLYPIAELIRCKDCKHRTHDKTCIKVMKRKPDEGYCDEGEVNKWEV